MVLSSLPVIRRTGYFEAFHYTHLLYNIFYIMLMVHAPNFWYWFIIPGVVFIVEAIIRVRNSFGSHGYTYITQGVLLPSRVVHLVIKRPPNFTFSPGDWVFVQIPGIARTEWHPFTISSAPEMDDFLWLHIRAVGEWTNRVYDYFLNEEKKMVLKKEQSVRTRRYSPIRGSFQFRVQRGKSYPPSTSPESSPKITPHSSLSSEEDPNCQSSKNFIECRTKRPINKIASTPVEKPTFNRAISSMEALKGFDRQFSKVYVLPKPNDCDENGKRKRSFFHTVRKVQAAQHLGNLDLETGVRGVRGGELWQLLSQRSRSTEETKSDLTGEMIKLEKPLYVHLDGPYGSPTSHIFQQNMPS